MTPLEILNGRFRELQGARAPWDKSAREIGSLILPWRIKMNESRRGREPNDEILDPTATLAVRTCAAGLAAGSCSESRVWFRYGPPAALLSKDRRAAESREVKIYLLECEDVIRDILRRSNFYGVTSGAVFYDLPSFATAGVLIEEHDRRVANFKPLPWGQYWLSANSDGEIDTVYRRYSMTARQLVQEYGIANCSSVVREQIRRHQYETTHQIMHVIEPNRRDEATGFEGQRSGRWGWEGMDYRSVHYEIGRADDPRTGFLRVSGYRNFPGVFPRWTRTSPEDVYGTGPAHESLPDVKQLQTMVRRKLQMVEKQGTPPLRGDAEIMGYPSQLPGAFVPVPSGGGQNGRLEPIHVPDANAVEQVRLDIEGLRYAIREGLFADLWRIITDDERTQPPTAEEVRAKREERLLQLGPVSNNTEGEYFRPTLDRVFYLADDRGMLPEPPAVLEGYDIKTEFLSVFGEAQKAQEIPAIERVAAFVKALAEMDEEVLDTGDWDKFAQKYADYAMIPPDLMRPPDELAERRSARRAKAAAQEQGAALREMASGARDLAASSLEDDNALSRVVGKLGPTVGAQAGALPVPGAAPPALPEAAGGIA